VKAHTIERPIRLHSRKRATRSNRTTSAGVGAVVSLDQQLAELMRRSQDGDRHAYEAFLVEVMALVCRSLRL